MARLVAVSLEEADELEAAVEGIRERWPNVAEILTRMLRQSDVREHMSTTEAAEYLGVTPQTVRNWVDRGWLEAIMVGSHRRIPRSVLANVIAFQQTHRRLQGRLEPVDEAVAVAALREHRAARAREARRHPRQQRSDFGALGL